MTTTGWITASIVCTAFVYLWLNDAHKRRRARSTASQEASPSTALPLQFWPLSLALGLIFLYLIDQGPAWAGRGPGFAVVIGAAPIVLVVACVVLTLAWYWARNRDPVLTGAARRADAGDLDGAIDDLRHAIQHDKATANRYGGLGVLLVSKQDWDGAVEAGHRALELAPDRIDLASNMAVALLKADRAHEAAQLFDKLITSQTADPLILNNYACALAQVGRVEEAEAYLRRAQAALAAVKYLTVKDIRGQIEAAFEHTRGVIAEARGEKAVGNLEEV